MKKLSTLALLCIGVLTTQMAHANGDGTIKLPSTNVPYPLGRYVELTSNEIPFKITDPDRDGNGQLLVNFNFKILRHVPNIEYVHFRIESNPGNYFTLKFKKDPNAVESLANAIANRSTNRAIVQWSTPFSHKTRAEVNRERNKLNGQAVTFQGTSIFIRVPQSRIHIDGQSTYNSTRCGEAMIAFYANHNTINITLSAELYTGSNPTIQGRPSATIRTTDGQFEATLFSDNTYNPSNVPINSSVTLNFGGANTNNIRGTDMDMLLSSDIEVEIHL